MSTDIVYPTDITLHLQFSLNSKSVVEIILSKTLDIVKVV